MYDVNDMILPEGFDPNAPDMSLFEETPETPVEETATEETPETESPTTESTVPETDQSTETEAPEQTPDPTTDPVQTDEGPKPDEAPTKVKIHYNHEDRELTLEEAAQLAQKGLNYDRIAARSKEHMDRISRYDQMAKTFGFENADAMMAQAEQNYVETKVQDLMKEGNTEAMARFLVSQEMNSSKSPAASPAKSGPAQEAAPGITPERKEELDEFIAAYPGVTKIPDAVFELHREGVRLKAAYAIYEKQQAQQQALEKIANENKAAIGELAILKQNQAAAVKGPVTGTVGKAPPEKTEARDPFLVGFDSESHY